MDDALALLARIELWVVLDVDGTTDVHGTAQNPEEQLVQLYVNQVHMIFSHALGFFNFLRQGLDLVVLEKMRRIIVAILDRARHSLNAHPPGVGGSSWTSCQQLHSEHFVQQYIFLQRFGHVGPGYDRESKAAKAAASQIRSALQNWRHGLFLPRQTEVFSSELELYFLAELKRFFDSRQIRSIGDARFIIPADYFFLTKVTRGLNAWRDLTSLRLSADVAIDEENDKLTDTDSGDDDFVCDGALPYLGPNALLPTRPALPRAAKAAATARIADHVGQSLSEDALRSTGAHAAAAVAPGSRAAAGRQQVGSGFGGQYPWACIATAPIVDVPTLFSAPAVVRLLPPVLPRPIPGAGPSSSSPQESDFDTICDFLADPDPDECSVPISLRRVGLGHFRMQHGGVVLPEYHSDGGGSRAVSPTVESTATAAGTHAHEPRRWNVSAISAMHMVVLDDHDDDERPAKHMRSASPLPPASSHSGHGPFDETSFDLLTDFLADPDGSTVPVRRADPRSSI